MGRWEGNGRFLGGGWILGSDNSRVHDWRGGRGKADDVLVGGVLDALWIYTQRGWLDWG